jgi:hypothetical protein
VRRCLIGLIYWGENDKKSPTNVMMFEMPSDAGCNGLCHKLLKASSDRLGTGQIPNVNVLTLI